MTLDDILKKLQQGKNVQSNVERNSSSVSKLMQDEMNKIREKEQKENTNKKQDSSLNNIINNGRNISNTISSNVKQIVNQDNKSWLDKYMEMQKYGMSGDLGNETLNKTRNAFRAPIGFIVDIGKKGVNAVKKEIDYNTDYYKNAKAELEKENSNMSEVEKYLKIALQKNGQNLGDAVNVLDNARQGANRGIISFGKYAYGVADWLTDYMENGMEKFLKNHINDDFEKLINIDFGKGAENLNKKNRETRDKIRNSFNNELEEYDKAIQENYEETQDPMLKKTSELSPSMGNSTFGLVLNSVPGGQILAPAYFMSSAGGSYMKEAEDRGATKGQALVYGTALGITEGATEKLELGWLTEGAKSLGKGVMKEAFKKYGANIAENYIQEALMEPIQETANQLVFGESDWSNMLERMNNAGIDGALSALILDGASSGLGSSINIVNKIQNNEVITQTDIEIAKKDLRTITEKLSELEANSNNLNVINTQMVEQKKTNIDTANEYLNTEKEAVEELKNNSSSNVQNVDVNNINDVNVQKKYVESVKKYNIDIENEAVKTISNMASQRGIELSYDDTVFKRSNQTALWRVNKETGQREVIINPKADSTRALQSIAVHEIVHDMENTGEYKGLSKIVLDYAKKQDNYDEAFKELLEIYAEEYKNYEEKEFNSRIEQEMVADILGEKLGNQEFVNNITSTDRNIAQKVYNWVVDKLNKVNKLTGYKFEKLYWADVKNKFEKAFNSEFNNIDGETKYHISSNLSNDIDRIIKNGEQRNSLIRIRDYTPEILVNYGLEKIPMNIFETHVTSNILTKEEGVKKGYNEKRDWHGLGKDNFIRTIDSLDNPVGIFRWKTNTKNKYTQNDYIILTEVYGKFEGEDSRIIVPFSMEKIDGAYRVKSIYGKRNVFKYLNKMLSQNLLEKIYTKRSTNNFGEGQSLTETTNTSTKNSITQKDTNVNYINTDNKGRKLSTQQQEIYKNVGDINSTTNDDIRYSKLTSGVYQKFIKDNFSNNGTKTYMKDVLVPVKEKKTAIPINEDNSVNEFNGYTDKEIRNISSNKISIASSNVDIINFAKKSKSIPGSFKMYIGKVKESVSNIVKNKIGIDISDYNISIKTDAIRHSLKGHSDMNNEQTRGQIPLVEQDFANIPLIINSADNISYEGKNKQDKPVIKFEKNINGNNVVITYVSDKHKNLELQTMYKFKNNKKMDSVTTSNVNNTLDRTSETNSDTNPINNIIPRGENYVNNAENGQESTKVDKLKVNAPFNEEFKEKQRKRYKTIIESDLVSKEAKMVAKELMGVDTYVPESNVQQLNKADYTIEQLGTERALDTLKGKIDGGQKITGDDIALGDRLIQYYSKTGEKARLQDAIQYTAMAGTEAGRTVQAMSIIAHQSPEGQALWIERSVKKLNQKMASKKGAKIDVVEGKQVAIKKGKNLDLQLFEFTADMKEKLMSVKSNEEMYSVLDEIYEELGQQVPKSTMEKIDSWRYFSMLANPTTHVRNIAGNTAMTGIQSVKNVVAGGIEDVVSLFNKDMERSKSVVRLTNLNKATLKFAMKDIKNVADRLGLNQNKYSPTSRIESNKREFKSNILNKTLGNTYKLNSKFLEVEDGWGLKFNYAKELTEYIVANKYDVNNITDEQLGRARNYAIEKAKEATFHQESKLASAINQIGNNNEITKFILDSTLPFKSVPINVAKTGLEYSPLQIVKSATVDIASLRNGKITINQYIDNISKGLTGTGIAIVGYALAQAGILKASGSDDDKEYYDEKQGKQAYSIQIGGKTFSLSWLAPTAIPLFIGVEIAENMNSDKNEKGSISSDDDTKYNKAIKSATNILDAFTNCMNPMTEMSMLSGLTSTLKSYDQGSTQFLTSLGTNITKSYVNQFVPTILGKVARLTDDYERDTTSTKKGVLPKAIDSTINQTMNKIPGLRKMLPTKKDVWGNEVKQTDNFGYKILENTIIPFTVKDISKDKVDKEINTLYDKTKETSIIPKNISKDFVIDGQRYRLTNKEYNEYQAQYGKTTHKTITEVMKSSTYKDLSDNEKADIIKEIYSDTKEILKNKFADERKLEYKRSDTDVKIDELVDGGLNVANAYIYKTIVNKIQGDKDKDGKSISGSEATKKVKYIYDIKDNDTQKDKLLSLISDTDTKPTMYDLKKLNGNYLTYMQQSGKKNDKGVSQRDKYMMYVDTGIPVKTLNKYYAEIGKIEGVKDKNGKTISGSKKKAIFKYINSLPLSAVQKKILFTKSNASYGKSYKREIFNYINKLPISKARKEQIWKELYD